jgi:alkylation response protein AidB-like acyl-CoA dehydrogenase
VRHPLPPIDALPADVETHRARLAAFLGDEVLVAERRAGVRCLADATGELRRWVRTRSADLGIFRALQPCALGGAGLGSLALAALHEEVGASGAVLGPLAIGTSGGLLTLATPEQRARFLEPVLRGDLDVAFAFTDAREGPRTTAVRHGDAYVLSGVKAFVTGGPGADLLVTVANVTENAGGPTGTALFVVPRTTPGVTLRRELRTLDGEVHGEFVFSDVRVGTGDVLGAVGEGLPRAMANITQLRLRAAALACGAGRRALDATLGHVVRPHRSGTPLADRDHVQAMIAASATELFAARAALYAAARLADGAGDQREGVAANGAGQPDDTDGRDVARGQAATDVEVAVAMAKVLATENVARIVDRAIQLTGAAAVVEDHPLAALYRRIRGWRIGEGTSEVLALIIARRLLASLREGTEWSR